MREVPGLMKAKLLRKAGDIAKGDAVEIKLNRRVKRSSVGNAWGDGVLAPEPVYEVTDSEGHTEKVDTRDLEPLP